MGTRARSRIGTKKYIKTKTYPGKTVFNYQLTKYGELDVDENMSFLAASMRLIYFS